MRACQLPPVYSGALFVPTAMRGDVCMGKGVAANACSYAFTPRALTSTVLGLAHGLAHQLAAQGRALTACDHPAHDESTEDVEQNVQAVVAPLLVPTQLRDVQGPYFVRAVSQELRLCVVRPAHLISAFADLPLTVEVAVLRGLRSVLAGLGWEVRPVV
jgi:hypothetical protein